MNRFDKSIVFNWLGDIDAASKLVAAFDFARIIGRRKDDDGNLCGRLVLFDLTQDLDSIHAWHVDIKQQQQRTIRCSGRIGAFTAHVIQGLLAIADTHQIVSDPSTLQITHHQGGVTIVIFRQQDN